MIDFDENSDENVKEYMNELITKLSKGGKKPRILFHVDEHRKMCNESDPGADFSKGAMGALAMAFGKDGKSPETGQNMDEEEEEIYVTVVATYTDKPDLPVLKSSEVCRYPLGIPPIDIERVMKETKMIDGKKNYYYPFHFPFGKKDLDSEGKRLFATLKFKLAMKISQIGLENLHITVNRKYSNLCKDFHEIASRREEGLTKQQKKWERKKKLKECSNLCNIEIATDFLDQESPHAIKLLLGVADEHYEEELKGERLKNQHLLVFGNLWTT